jgi:DNA-binding transcriptional ArsR family regulator
MILCKVVTSVRDIASIVGVSESAISHQLRILNDRRVVKRRRHGTSMYYSVDDPHIAAMIREAEYHADHAFRRAARSSLSGSRSRGGEMMHGSSVPLLLLAAGAVGFLHSTQESPGTGMKRPTPLRPA